MLAMIIEKQSFGAALAFIIARTRADRVDVAPIGFRLRMDEGVAINFRRRCLHDPDFQAFGEAKHVDGAEHAGLRRLDGIELIMDRRGGTGEIINFVDFNEKRKGDVVTQKLEALMIDESVDVAPSARKKIIDAEDFVTFVEETQAKMRAEKSSAASDQNTFLAEKHDDPSFRVGLASSFRACPETWGQFSAREDIGYYEVSRRLDVSSTCRESIPIGVRHENSSPQWQNRLDIRKLEHGNIYGGRCGKIAPRHKNESCCGEVTTFSGHDYSQKNIDLERDGDNLR
jgi:uncharacterized protein (DUF736 family)